MKWIKKFFVWIKNLGGPQCNWAELYRKEAMSDLRFMVHYRIQEIVKQNQETIKFNKQKELLDLQIALTKAKLEEINGKSEKKS